MVVDKRFLIHEGREYDLGITLPRKEPNYEATTLRDGIEKILDLHGEEYIKTRLRRLLNGPV